MKEKITEFGKKIFSSSTKRRKKILTLGLSNSGKTNFVVASMAYAVMHGDKQGRPFDKIFKYVLSDSYNWLMSVVSTATFRAIDYLLADYFYKGRWCVKTAPGTYNDYKFDLRGNVAFRPPYFRRPKSITLRDWSGESFSAITGGTSTQDNVDRFKTHCAEADGFLLCIDGGRLIDEGERDKMKDCITNFCEVIGWLRDDDPDDFSSGDTGGETQGKTGGKTYAIRKQKRSFAIVVTKADLLVNLGELRDDETGKLSLYKLSDFLQQSYPLFFSVLQEQMCSAEIFAVSLVPKREFREIKLGDDGGIKPSKKWNLKDVMECAPVKEAEDSDCKRYHNNMWGAFRWLLDNV